MSGSGKYSFFPLFFYWDLLNFSLDRACQWCVKQKKKCSVYAPKKKSERAESELGKRKVEEELEEAMVGKRRRTQKEREDISWKRAVSERLVRMEQRLEMIGRGMERVLQGIADAEEEENETEREDVEDKGKGKEKEL